LEKLGALDWKKVVQGNEKWRLITAMWLHAGIIHLVMNMFDVIIFGIRLEQQFGFSKSFLSPLILPAIFSFSCSIHVFKMSCKTILQ